MQPCLFWTGERAELRITSVELLTEYHLARDLIYVEVVRTGGGRASTSGQGSLALTLEMAGICKSDAESEAGHLSATTNRPLRC